MNVLIVEVPKNIKHSTSKIIYTEYRTRNIPEKINTMYIKLMWS